MSLFQRFKARLKLANRSIFEEINLGYFESLDFFTIFYVITELKEVSTATDSIFSLTKVIMLLQRFFNMPSAR